MVKLRGPLHSNTAQGSIGNILTFSRRQRRNVCRHQEKQKDVATAARDTQRGYFTEAIAQWHTLSAGEQQQWHDFVRGV